MSNMISTIFMINAYKCITPWKYTVCYHETIRSQKLDSSSAVFSVHLSVILRSSHLLTVSQH